MNLETEIKYSPDLHEAHQKLPLVLSTLHYSFQQLEAGYKILYQSLAVGVINEPRKLTESGVEKNFHKLMNNVVLRKTCKIFRWLRQTYI